MQKYLLLFVLFISAGAPQATELKGTPEELGNYLLNDKKLVTITGRAEERVEADNAIVALNVKTKDSKLHVALQKNRAIRAELKKKLEAAGIAPNQIQVAKYSSTPSYGWFGDKPKSYDVNNEVKITISKEDELAVIAEFVDSKDEVYFGNTSIKFTKKKEAKARALEKSLEDVLAKKAQYEKQLGFKLVAVGLSEQTVEENQNLRQRNQQVSKVANYSSSAPAGMLEMELDEAGGFGELYFRAQTTVTFAAK